MPDTRDHILYNSDMFELISLLEFRDAVMIPNALYPSDHMRIEATF